MKFLTNENIPKSSVELLRAWGHDVVSISETAPGTSDRQVLEIASREQRVVVTFDADYGELIFFEEFPSPLSVLYLRIQPISPTEPAELIQALLATDRDVLEGHFVVLDRQAIRRRALRT